MTETELKILEIDVDDIQKKLETLGATYKGKFFIRAKHFDFPDRRFRDNEQYSICRIRSVGERVEFAFKYGGVVQDGLRSAEELEVVVSDFETTEKILTQIGLSPYRIMEKYRHSYRLGNTALDIEIHPHVPPLIEIEGAAEDIQNTVLALGYTMNDTTALTMGEVFETYGLNPNHQVFDTP